MKINFTHLKYIKLIVFLFIVSSATAQCPTISDNNPPPICDASGYTFADLSAAYAVDTGGGISWYSEATGLSSLRNSNERVQAGTYYIDDINGTGCGVRPQITISFEVDPFPAAITIDKFFCEDDNAIIQDYIDDALSPYVPANGSVNVYYIESGNTGNLAGVNNSIAFGNIDYHLVFIDALGCESQIKRGKTIVGANPANPNPPTPQLFCVTPDNTPTIADLIPGTEDRHFWYEALDVLDNPIQPALADNLPLEDGKTYYVQVDNGSCQSETRSVTVAIDTPYLPGTPTPLHYCEGDVLPANINLFDQLAGPKDTNGVWSNTLGLTTTNGHLGTVDLSGLTTPNTYTFTYTVPESPNGVCPETPVNVDVIIHKPLSPGTANPPYQICIGDITPGQTYDLFELLAEEELGGTWYEGTDNSGLVVADPTNLDISLLGGANNYNFTYIQNELPNPCPDDPETVLIRILPDPNAGDPVATQPICENALVNNFDLFTTINGQDNNNGTWHVGTDITGAIVPDPNGIIDITTFTVAGSPYAFTYNMDNGGCNDTETIEINIAPAPDSGVQDVIPVLCANNPGLSAYNLFSLLNNTQSTNDGIWYVGSGTTGAIIPTPDAADVTGLGTGALTFTYTVPDIDACSDTPAIVNIQVTPLPNTGIPKVPSPQYCIDDVPGVAPLNLVDQLQGADPNGVWTDDNGPVIDPTAIDISALPQVAATYNFYYTIVDPGTGCTNSSTVTVEVSDDPKSGTYDGDPEVFCIAEITAGQIFNLFDLLEGEDQTGTWIDDSGSAALSGDNNNIVALDALTARDYIFTYDVLNIGSCDDANVPVQITINPAPNPGAPILPAPEYCENDNSTIDLHDFLNGQQMSGTWFDETNTPLPNSTLDLTPLAIGAYTFTYVVADPVTSCSDSSEVVITINDAPESGTVNGKAVYCEANAVGTFDLYDLLDGADLGLWTDDDSGTAALSGSMVNLADLAAVAPGNTQVFNFTHSVVDIGACSDDPVTVQVVIFNTANAGTANGISPQYCESVIATQPDLDLFTLLDNTVDKAAGTWSWTDPDGTGALTNNILEVSLLETISSYTFTYTIDGGPGAGCSDFSQVSVEVLPSPELPTVEESVKSFCVTDITVGQMFDLSTMFSGTYASGVWFDNNGVPLANSNVSIELPVGDYIFTYDVDPLPNGCENDDTTVQISIVDSPNAGTALPLAPICIDDATSMSSFNLHTLLNGTEQSSGIWYDEAGTALPNPNNIIDLTGLSVADYNFTYVVDPGGSCTRDEEPVVLSIVDIPSSGIPTTGNTFCFVETIGETSYNLLELLGDEGQNGTWYIGNNTSGTVTPNPINLEQLAQADPNSKQTFSFTYLVDSVGSCNGTPVTVTFDIEADITAPTVANATQEFCNTNLVTATIADLTATGSSIKWYENATGGSPLADTTVLEDSKTYYATQTDVVTTVCESSERTPVLARVYQTPNAGGLSATPILECNTNNAINLDNGLNGTQDTYGVWLDTAGVGGALTGNILDATGLAAGDYTFTYEVDAGPCGKDTTEITVTIEAPLSAGDKDETLVLCISDSPVNLFTVLANAGTGGEWTAPDSSDHSGTFDPANDASGRYTYSLTNSCGIFTSNVDVTVNQIPNAGGLSATQILECNTNNAINLDNGLNGTQDTYGVWLDTDGTSALTGNIFDATGLAAGDYKFTYEVDAGPCGKDTTEITVTIEAPLSAGDQDETLPLCSTDSPINLFTVLANADPGGEWTTPDSSVISGDELNFDPTNSRISPLGIYTYTVTNACGSFSRQVDVSVTTAPDAGETPADPTEICVVANPIDLYGILGATPSVNGSWSANLIGDPAALNPADYRPGPYTFTYTVTATSPCSINDEASVTIIVDDIIAPGVTDANPNICLQEGLKVSDLESFLTVTGDSVTWYEDDGAGSRVLADPDYTFLKEDEDKEKVYYATQTNANGCESSTSTAAITVTVLDTPTPALVSSPQELCFNTKPTIATLSDDIVYDSSAYDLVWYDTDVGGSVVPSTTLLENGTSYFASLTDKINPTACQSSKRLEIEIDLTGMGCQLFPDGFSPNGDGNNDTFTFNNPDSIGLEGTYPNFELEIYNRYGNIVYKGNANTPPFDGTSNQRNQISKGDLPVGVYYYIFKYNDGENEPVQGHLYLSR